MADAQTDVSAAEAQQHKTQRGIVCPKCGGSHWYTHKTFRRNGDITRRRICRNCGTRITTAEFSVG